MSKEIMMGSPQEKEESIMSEEIMMDTPEEKEENVAPSRTYFKVLDFCDLIFSQPFRILSCNATCFLGIALVASGYRALLAFIFDVINGDDYGADYGTDVDYFGENISSSMDAATMTMAFIDNLILFVVKCLADGAAIQVVANIYSGQTTAMSPVDAIGTAAFKAVPLVGSLLLVTVVFVAFFMILAMISIPIFYAAAGNVFYNLFMKNASRHKKMKNNI